MLLAAILFLGILSMWVPARWALSAFQIAVFALAAPYRIAPSEKSLAIHPTAVLLGAAVVWGLLQASAGWTVDRFKTLNEVLNWTTNLAVFALALELSRDERRRERFLSAVLWFGTALAAISMLTVFSSPPGIVFWLFNAGSDRRTLGPFVYYNQYAAFIEAVLPLALVRAILDQRRRMLYSVMGALLLASVVAGGSRAGTILCLAEVIVIPLVALGQGIVSRRAVGRVLLASREYAGRPGRGRRLGRDLEAAPGAEPLRRPEGFPAVQPGDDPGSSADRIRAGNLVGGLPRLRALRRRPVRQPGS